MNEGYKKFYSIYLSVTVLINVLSPKCWYQSWHRICCNCEEQGTVQ